MKKSSKILCRIIAASMIITMAAGTGMAAPVSQVIGTSISVNAEEYGDYEYEVNEDDTVTITRYNGEEKNVTIPSKIDGKQVTIIGRYAFENSRQSLQSVVIPSGVVRINERAFQYCEKLKTVTLPEGLKVLEDAVFEFCYSLREIKLPSTLEEAGTYQFQHDRNLSSVTLSPKMTRIADCMFQDCNSLEEITIPDSIEEIGNYAFNYCRNLKKVNIGANSKLKYIRQSFSYTALESFTLPETVEEISGWCFERNYHLKDFTFNSKVSVIPDGFFCECTSLENIVIPDNVQEIWNRAFSGCTNLKTVTMGANVREIAWESFNNCTSLTDVYFGAALSHIGDNVFAGCSSLVNFHNIPENYITFDYHVFETSKWYAEKPDGAVYFGNVLYNYKGTVAQNENVVIPEGTVSFNKNIFGENTGLKSVTIPASMGQIDFGYLFDGSKNLENITVAANHPNYKSIDGIVYNKEGTEMIYCPRGKAGALVIPEGVEYIDSGSLTGCTKITSLTFSKSLYDFTTVDLTSMSSLASISVPSENERYMSKDGVLFGAETDDDGNKYPYVLYCCPPAKTGAYTIPDTVRELHWSAFNNSTKLTSLNIPKSVRWLMNFENLTTLDSLTAINMAQESESDYCTVNGILYNKDMTEMHYVPNAKSGAVTIPDGIETIYGAFYNCKKVTQVNIPASVNEIYEDSFDNCTALTKFTVAQDNETYKAVNGALIRKDDNDYLLCVPKAVKTFTVPDSIYNHDRMRDNAFINCNSITTLNIGANFDFSWWWYYNAHFNICPNLKTVNVDENNVNYKSIDGVVYNNESVVFVPPAYEGVLNVPKFVVSCWDGAFKNCSKLTAVNFSSSYTDTINFDIFNDSYALENIYFPNNGNYTIENGAVYNREKTELYHVFDGTSGEFVIPSGVKYVNENAFINCSKLTKIVINNDLSEFNANLYGCTSLKALEVPANITRMYENNFENISEDFVIEGYAGTHAEQYANYHNYTFHRLSDEITLNKTAVTTAVGRTFKLIPTIKTEATFDKTVTFTSENAKVAKVAADGTVTAVSAGTVKITATTVNGKTASCLVTVNPALSNVSEISSDNILVNAASTVTVKALDGTGTYKYAVDYRLSGADKWTSLLAKGTTATANFTTATAGTYEIKATVTDKDGYTAEKIFTVKVNANLANTSTVSATKTTLGNAVTVNGKSTGGLGGTTYKYEYKLSSASVWTVLSDYSTADSTVFKPSAAGTYNIRVTAKDSSGTTVSKTLNVTVTDTLANTTAISAEKIMVNGKVTVNVSAAGGMSDYTYACYMKAAGASSWTTVSNFGNKTSFELSFDKSGNYIICTKAKDQNGTIAKEYVSVSVYDVLKNISSVENDTIVFGDTFTVNAGAADGMGGYTYAVSYKKTSDTNWVVKQNYAENSTVTVKPSNAADYIINVKVKDTVGNIAEKNFSVKVNALIENTSTVSSDFITLGEMAVINGKAKGGSGEKTYKYEYKLSSGQEWTILSDYSDDTVAIFKPVEAGKYDIRVTVKDGKGSTAEKTFEVNTVGILVNNSTLSSDNIVIGDTVTITGSASGGKGDYQYAYFYKKFTQKNWTKIADYSSNTSAKATPKSYGDYQICVKVKDKDGTVAAEYLNVIVNDKLKNNSTISAESIVLGNTFKVTAAAADGMGGYTYAVLYKKASDSKWTTKQDFKANASVDIKPANAVKYDVCVKVKDISGTIEKKFFTVDVKAALTNDSAISAESIELGNSVTVNAKAAGGAGSYQYQVVYKKKTDTKWATAQNFSTNTTVSFKPASAVQYDVCVKVKDSDGTIVKKFFELNVTAGEKLANHSTISAASIAKGQTVTVKCAATGGKSPYTYAVFYKQSAQAKWTTKQDFAENDTVTIKPANATTYDVCAKVKDADGTIVKEYFTVEVK